jgi:hypothetical protein
MNQLFGMNFFKVFYNFYILQISCVFILNILLQNIILLFLGDKKYIFGRYRNMTDTELYIPNTNVF